MNCQTLLIHGVAVTVESAAPEALELMCEELSGFPPTERPGQVRISFEEVASLREAPAREADYADALQLRKYRYDRAGSTLTFHGAAGCVQTARQRRRWQIRCSYVRGSCCLLELGADAIYDLAYVVLPQVGGAYPLHAAAVVSPAGRSVVVLANSFAGKTTLSLAALCAGWGILSDDMPLLTLGPRRSLVALAFPRSLRVCSDTLAVFPALAGRCHARHDFVHLSDEITTSPGLAEELAAQGHTYRRRGTKYRVRVQDAFPGALLERSEPTDLVLLSRGESYECRPCPPHAAMNELLRQNLLMYAFRNPRQAVYAAFCEAAAALISQCRVHALVLGGDIRSDCARFVEAFSGPSRGEPPRG